MPRLRDVLALSLLAATSCDALDDARSAEIASVLVRGDQAMLTSRRALVEGKYARMARSPYEFYRGSMALFLHDAATGRTDPFHVDVDETATPFSIGDAHVENFGTFQVDGAFVVEPNDCDAADRWPYLTELRRLTVALGVSAHVANPTDETARAAAVAARPSYARAALVAYRDEIVRLAKGETVELSTSRMLDDLVRRSRNDLSPPSELVERTRLVDGARTLVRGGIDEDDPENVYVDVARVVEDALPATFDALRERLDSPPPAGFFRIKDVVRELGSGVASFARVRLIVLVEGPSDAVEDDVLLEVKEIGDSGAPLLEPPFVVADDVGARIDRCVREVVGDPARDPLWGTSTLFGLPVQIRQDREAHKTLRTNRLEEDLGTPEVIMEMASALGQRLARVHARSGKTVTGAIADDVRGREGFVDDEVAFAEAYTARVLGDFARFRLLLEDLGPALGFRSDGEANPDPDVAALLGVPSRESSP